MKFGVTVAANSVNLWLILSPHSFLCYGVVCMRADLYRVSMQIYIHGKGRHTYVYQYKRRKVLLPLWESFSVYRLRAGMMVKRLLS